MVFLCMTEQAQTPNAGRAEHGDVLTCVFPGCDRPRRPGKPDTPPGAKPRFCDLTDVRGKLVHTAATANRARNPARLISPMRSNRRPAPRYRTCFGSIQITISTTAHW
jgi:hypothetical protein